MEEQILFESIQNDEPAEFKSSKDAANLIRCLLIKDPKGHAHSISNHGVVIDGCLFFAQGLVLLLIVPVE